MWSAITLLELPQRPQPEMCDLLTLRAILSGNPDDEPTSAEWTYGGFLLETDWDDTDITLRNVVARCLCDDPRRRPTMLELEALFEARRAQGEVRPGEFDEAKKWSWKFFGGGPPAERPEPAPVPSGAGTEGEGGATAPAPALHHAHEHQKQAAAVGREYGGPSSPLRVYRDPQAPVAQRQVPTVREERGPRAFALAPAPAVRDFALRPTPVPTPLRNVAYAPVEQMRSPVVRERGTAHLVPLPLRLPQRLKRQSQRQMRGALADVTAERGNPVIRPNEAGGSRERRPAVRSGAGRERPASNRAREPRAGEGGAGGAGDRRSASRVGAGRDDGRGEGPATTHTRESRVREGGEGVQKTARRNPARAARPKKKDTPPKKAPKPVKSPKKGLARWVRALGGASGQKKERK